MGGNGWQEVVLGDVADELTVGHVGSMTHEYVQKGVPFLRSKNIEPYRIDFNGLCFISREFHERLTKSALRPGDVVIVRTGKPGACTVIPDTLGEANCSDLVIVRPGKNLNARFLCYYLNTLASHHVSAHLVGAVQQHFNVGSARQLRMRLPSREEQDAIAGILGTLDDKIELNRRMNETLEAMVRAIFKSWFVDFDPVRAKMEGRKPEGMDAATAKLFPDGFENSELGAIPSGWKVARLDALCKFSSGGTPSKANPDYWAGTIPWVSAKDMKSSHLYDSEDHLTEIGAGNGTRKVSAGTTLLLVRGMTLHNDVPICLTMREVTFNQDVKALTPNDEAYQYYVFLMLRALKPDLLRQVDAASHGTGRINTDLLRTREVVLPTTPILGSFNRVLLPIFERLRVNDQESCFLTSIRDAMLPALLTGKLAIRGKDRVALPTLLKSEK